MLFEISIALVLIIIGVEVISHIMEITNHFLDDYNKFEEYYDDEKDD